MVLVFAAEMEMMMVGCVSSPLASCSLNGMQFALVVVP